MGAFSRWLRDEGDDIHLPLPPDARSNGEFVPPAPTPFDRDVARAMIATAADAARALGMDRRRFLQTSGGVAAALAVLNLAACSPHRSGARGGATTSGPGGSFGVPPTTDIAACDHALGSQGEFIVDVHTHHVVPAGPWRRNAPATVRLVEHMVPADCDKPDRLECVNRAAYVHDMFLASDTSVAMLTDVPNSGPTDAPLPVAEVQATREFVDSLTRGGAVRVLVNSVLAPNVGPIEAQLENMSKAKAAGPIASFKVYPAWNPSGPGFSVDDPTIGLPVIQRAHDLGVKVFIAHKGLPLVNFDAAHNHPDDMVAVSRIFPDMQFVIFHGAWDPAHAEGPYNARATTGIDSLLAALERHQVPPNSNVWVDLATLWRQLLHDPTQAAHALGKLLTRVGPQRVLWGTDSIWYGSPQPQIMAFRAFQISPALRDRFGYPELTPALKADVLGANAARLFGLDANQRRCALDHDPLAAGRSETVALRSDGALVSAWARRGPSTRREMLSWMASPLTRWTPW